MNSIGTSVDVFAFSSTSQARKVVKDVAATDYTLLAEDIDKMLQFTADTEVKVKVPAGLPENGRYEIKQLGLGKIAVSAANGVSLYSPDPDTYGTTVRYSHFVIDWVGTVDKYVLFDKENLPALKLNKGANTEYENLADTSEIHGFALFNRLGAIFRSNFLVWNESLKKLTIKGSQAIWEAYMEVTDGNMGIKALIGAVESFKLFDNIGNFFSTGTEGGKRLFRIFTATRLMNGSSFNETEYKAIECLGLVTTLLKSVTLPDNSILTVDVFNIAVMNVDKNYVTGKAQFSFKNNGGVVSNISINALRYDDQNSVITNGMTLSRIDASITDKTASINFVNTVDKLTNVHCEIKYTITLMPEA
ncbi:hypothetical protein [Flavobacterium sp.]|uniref:hypothetical protein n=1 Tax=Flavobacterium sp. TaxID=239 RepID=UPI0040339C36